MHEEHIPVEVVRELGLPAEPTPDDGHPWRDWVVPLCAVLVAAAVFAAAWSQIRVARATERSNCMLQAQYATFFAGRQPEEDSFDAILASCGVVLPDPEALDGHPNR